MARCMIGAREGRGVVICPRATRLQLALHLDARRVASLGPLVRGGTIVRRTTLLVLLAALPAAVTTPVTGPADESVFVRGLRADQHEAVLYVWSSDADQKDADFLAVIDADPKSASYGKVIA